MSDDPESCKMNQMLTIKASITINVCFVFYCNVLKVSKEAKIRNRYNQVPHLTQDTIRESV